MSFKKGQLCLLVRLNGWRAQDNGKVVEIVGPVTLPPFIGYWEIDCARELHADWPFNVVVPPHTRTGVKSRHLFPINDPDVDVGTEELAGKPEKVLARDREGAA